MGMYDSIFFECPNCGKRLEAQSKAGECELYAYNKDNAPAMVAADCLGDILKCKCGKSFEVSTPWVFIPLTLKEYIR